MHTFSTQRFLAAPPSAVFAAMAQAERLARWWGPRGRWVFTMVGPDGARYPNACVFRQIEADRRVVIAHVVPPLFELHLELEPQAGGTRLAWVQVFEEEAVARSLAHIVEPANEQNLDRLGRELGLSPGA